MDFEKEIVAKIVDSNKLQDLIKSWRSQKLKIVFTNGVFDLMHPGHIDYLSKARALGDILIIGLNADTSVSRLKGPKRPINSENERAIMLAALYFIDAVIVFSEDTPLRLISEVLPDILVKGGDYSEETVVGADVVKKNNGKVMILPFLKGYSSSNIINKIIQGYERQEG